MVGPDGRDSRAQSETVGIVLLTGVVAVVALSVGAVIVTQTVDGSADQPRIDFEVSATVETLSLTHNGGDRVELSNLEVRLESGGGEELFEPGSGDISSGDADSRYEPAETIELEHGFGAGSGDVLVVDTDSNAVLLSDRLVIETMESIVYNDDAVAKNASGVSSGTKAAVEFTITNTADTKRNITDIKISSASADHLLETSGPGDFNHEVDIDTADTGGYADEGSEYTLGTKVMASGYEDDGTLPTDITSGETATVRLYQFKDASGNAQDMEGESVEVTLYLENGAEITFTLNL